MNGAAKSRDLVDDDTSDGEDHTTTDTSIGLILDAVGCVDTGLVLVTVPNNLLLSQVQLAVERQIRAGSERLGPRFPKKTRMKSLYPGGGRKEREARALAQAQKPLTGVALQEFMALGTRDGFTVTCDEGLCTVLPIIEKSKGDWVTVSQSIDTCSVQAVVDALMRLRAAAKLAECYVLFFLVTDRKAEEFRLNDCCDDLFITTKCDPDPGVHFAFSLDVVGLRNLNPMGIGKVMCSVRFRKGQFVWRWEPFISSDLLKRVIWKLRCSGKSLAEIGKIVQCDKSTVHRHMAGLPPLVKIETKEGWLKPYADFIEIAIESDDNEDDDEKE